MSNSKEHKKYWSYNRQEIKLYENLKMPLLTLKLYVLCKTITPDLNFSHRLLLP